MDLSELRNFDYFIVFIIGLSSYFGGSKGFIKSFIDFFAWVGSAIIAFDSYNIVFTTLNTYIPSKFICGFLASFGVYVALLFGVSYLGVKITEKTSKVCGSNIDKTLGLFFGLFRGVVVASAVFWMLSSLFNAFDEKKLPTWISEAKGFKFLKISSDTLLELTLSDEAREKVVNFIERKSIKLEEDLKEADKEQKSKSRKENNEKSQSDDVD